MIVTLTPNPSLDRALDVVTVAADSLKPSDEMRLGQEVESVQFYVAQGYFEDAQVQARRLCC